MNPVFYILALTTLVLAGCAPPPETETPFPSPSPSLTSSPTLEPTATPKSDWMKTVEIQDPQDKYFKVVDGKPTIDLYDTQTAESIVLNQETIKTIATTDGLNPNILTAKDADGNQYAFNPDFGWFKIPEVQMDYAKLAEYTEVEQSFIEDGRANIVTALKYVENPTISPDAVTPQYWANFGLSLNNDPYVFMSLYPSGNYGLAQRKWPDLSEQSSFYEVEKKPFAWTGFYKVRLENGETAYVVSRTLKNPTETNKNQTINLFYGFDKSTYEKLTIPHPSFPDWSPLRVAIERSDKGDYDFVAIFAPPASDVNGKPLSWNPDKVTRSRSGFPSPNIGKLQQRGELISFFSPKDQQTILDVLSEIVVEYEPGKTTNLWTSPLDFLPKELSKRIILGDFNPK
jgi:hypothetical protein